MGKLPYEIKLTYFIIIIVLACFIGFIIFLIIIYNRKQTILIRENQLKEAEHKNLILEKELEKQKSVQQERDRISRDMHDEIGAGISAIKLQSEILKQRIENKNFSNNEIDELITISDNMNSSMREMLWSLNSKNDIFIKFYDYCKNYADNYLSKTNIDLKFTYQADDNNKVIPADIRRNQILILKEALNNVVKHSQATEVKIKIVQKNNQLLTSIKDNGIGLKSVNKNGYGLSTMRSRAENIGGKFLLFSESNGTKIIIETQI